MTTEMSEQMNQMLSDSRLPLYEKAVVFAAIAHQGAHRKGSRIPYLSHPIEAAAIVSELTDDEELIAAAVLPDVVEDRKTRRCMAGFIVRQQKFCGNWKNIRPGRNMID